MKKTNSTAKKNTTKGLEVKADIRAGIAGDGRQVVRAAPTSPTQPGTGFHVWNE